MTWEEQGEIAKEWLHRNHYTFKGGTHVMFPDGPMFDLAELLAIFQSDYEEVHEDSVDILRDFVQFLCTGEASPTNHAKFSQLFPSIVPSTRVSDTTEPDGDSDGAGAHWR